MRQHKRVPRIDIVPLVDVLLVLILFFLVSMQFQDLKALNLKLPEIKTAGSNLALDDLVLSIRKNGDFLLNGNAISETALIEILSASVKYSQSPTLLISADEETPLKFVTKAIDICRTNGVGDFRLHSR